MEQYLITPWDTRTGTEPAPVNWDLQVPPEVDAIAEQVMRQYDMKVSSRTLITSKPDKGGAIWKIETNKGPRSLKLLHRTPERSLFSVGLQDYVVRQGARVPALIPANDGKLFVEMGGKLWIVTDWIALTPATKVDLVGAQELCYGLGEFHRHTKGYVPPFGAKNSSRLYRWPNYYQKIAKKIGWMREMAKAYRDTAASPSILAVVDEYERQALEALERLKASAYPRMVAMGEPHWGLVHQDYGWSNGQNGPGGLWVIDLDGVSYDLPFRDLRKLITSTMDDMGVWDLTWMRGMIDAYHQANPLDAESYDVLLIDMAVPNEFYKHLKEMFFDPLTFLNTEAEGILQRVVATDRTKAQALAELAAERSKYKPGSYESAAVPAEVKRISSDSPWDQQSWGLQPQEKEDRKAPAAEESKKGRLKIKKKDADTGEKRSEQEKEKPAEVVSSPVVPLKPMKKKASVPAAKRKPRAGKVSQRKVIPLAPYLSEESRAARSGQAKKKPISGEAVSSPSSKPAVPAKKPAVKKRGAAAVKKAGGKVVPLSKRRTAAAKRVKGQAAQKAVKSVKRVGSTKGKTKKAAQPGKKHSFTKVPAPSKKLNRQAANKPRPKKGVKTRGVR